MILENKKGKKNQNPAKTKINRVCKRVFNPKLVVNSQCRHVLCILFVIRTDESKPQKNFKITKVIIN